MKFKNLFLIFLCAVGASIRLMGMELTSIVADYAPKKRNALSLQLQCAKLITNTYYAADQWRLLAAASGKVKNVIDCATLLQDLGVGIALQYAVISGVNIIDDLMTYSEAYVDQVCDEDGNTALMVAIEHVSQYRGADNLTIIKKLLAHRADVNQKNGQGKTAIMIAHENNQQDTLDLLIMHGASIKDLASTIKDLSSTIKDLSYWDQLKLYLKDSWAPKKVARSASSDFFQI